MGTLTFRVFWKLKTIFLVHSQTNEFRQFLSSVTYLPQFGLLWGRREGYLNLSRTRGFYEIMHFLYGNLWKLLYVTVRNYKKISLSWTPTLAVEIDPWGSMQTSLGIYGICKLCTFLVVPTRVDQDKSALLELKFKS